MFLVFVFLKYVDLVMSWKFCGWVVFIFDVFSWVTYFIGLDRGVRSYIELMDICVILGK